MRLLIAALLLVHGAAMGQTFACQYTEVAGLKWENGRWVSARFANPSPFFLKIENNRLTADSVGKAVGWPQPSQIRCEEWLWSRLSCTVPGGAFLYFNKADSMGSVAQIFGATQPGSNRDSLYVAPFTCQKM